MPGRIDRYSTGPREEMNTASAISSSSGLSRKISSSDTKKSNDRLTT